MKKWLFLILLVPAFAYADDGQDQAYSDQRVRPYAETVRNLVNFTNDNIAAIGTVYADLCSPGNNLGWTDNRTDGVPNKLGPSDICAANAFFNDFKAFIAAESGGTNTNYNALLKAVVRQP